MVRQEANAVVIPSPTASGRRIRTIVLGQYDLKKNGVRI
jgi:hypothetical protein